LEKIASFVIPASKIGASYSAVCEPWTLLRQNKVEYEAVFDGSSYEQLPFRMKQNDYVGLFYYFILNLLSIDNLVIFFFFLTGF
jgi:hypothetical protein